MPRGGKSLDARVRRKPRAGVCAFERNHLYIDHAADLEMAKTSR